MGEVPRYPSSGERATWGPAESERDRDEREREKARERERERAERERAERVRARGERCGKRESCTETVVERHTEVPRSLRTAAA